MLLVRDLRTLRDQDLARLGDVAVFLSNLGMLGGLSPSSCFSPRSSHKLAAFAPSYYAPLLVFFTRSASWPLVVPLYSASLPDVCFASERELPTLTLTVPPGYAAFVREQPWEALRWAFWTVTGNPDVFGTWWQPFDDTHLSRTVPPGRLETLIRPMLKRREDLLRADLEALAPIPESIDDETCSKLFAVWARSVSELMLTDFDISPAMLAQRAAELFTRHRDLVTIRVRASRPPVGTDDEQPVPFDGTIRVGLRWLTVLVAECAIRFKHPREVLHSRFSFPLGTGGAVQELLAAIDTACDITRAYQPADLAVFPPEERELEMVSDLIEAVVH